MAYYDDPLSVLQPGAGLTRSAPGLGDWMRHPLDSYKAWADLNSQPQGTFLNQAPQGTQGNPFPSPLQSPLATPSVPQPAPQAAPAPTPALSEPNPALSQAPGPAPGEPSAEGPLPAPPMPPPGGPPASPMGEATAAAASTPTGGGWDIVGNKRNNPLNLRFAGQQGADNSNGFAAFPDQDAGLQAARNQFGLYAKRGINTLNGLVSTWAPPNENDTAAYISTVSGMTGIAPDQKIDLTDPDVQKKVMAAMSRVENGPGGSATGGTQVASGGQPAQAPQDTTTLSSQSSPDPQQAPQPYAVPGLGNDDIASLVNGFKPSRSDQMMALASGLLSGPTFGVGLGKGLQNLSATNQDARHLAIAAANARATAGYHTGLLGIKGGTLAQTINHQGNVDAVAGVKLDQGQQKIDQGGTRLDQGQQKIDQNDPIASARAQSALSTSQLNAAKTDVLQNGGAAQQKDNVTSESDFYKSLETARQGSSAAGDVLALLDKEGKAGLTGPDALSKMKRFMANNFDMDVAGVSPSGIALAQKDLANLQTKGIMGAIGGHAPPRAVSEYNAIGKGFGDMSTNPEALRAIVQQTIDSNNRLLAAGTAWRGMKPEEKNAALRQFGSFNGWHDAFTDKQPAYASMSGATQPAATIESTPNGWQHKDPSSGLGFTIH